MYHGNVRPFSVLMTPQFPLRQPTPTQGVCRTDVCCGRAHQKLSTAKNIGKTFMFMDNVLGLEFYKIGEKPIKPEP